MQSVEVAQDGPVALSHPTTAASTGLSASPHRRWADVVRRRGANAWPPVVAVVFCALLTWNRIIFANDDFPQFRAALDYGFSWRTASLNVFQHFAPINRLAHWYVERFSPLNTHLGYAVALAFFAWFAVALHLVLGELGTAWPRRAAIVSATGLSVPIIDTMSWFDGAMQWLPFIASLTTFLLFHLRYLHRRNVLRAGAAIVALLVCAMADIRFVLAVPLALLIDVNMVARGGVRQRAASLLKDLPYYVAVSAVTGFVAQEITSHYEVPGGPPIPRTSITASVMWESLTTFVPTRLAGYFAVQAFSPVVASCVALVMLCAAIFAVRRNRANLGPLIVLVLGGALSYAVLWKSDLLGAGPAANGRRSDYMLPALLLVVLAASQFTLRRAGQPRGTRYTPALTVAVTICVAALPAARWVNTGLIFSGLPYLSPSYLENVRAYEPLWSDSHNSLVELQAPDGLVAGWDVSQGRTRELLRLIDPAFPDTPLGPHPYFIDAHGSPETPTLLPVAKAASLPSCRRQTSGSVTVIHFGAPVVGAPLHVLVHVNSPLKTEIRFSASLRGALATYGEIYTVHPGSADWVVQIPADKFDSIVLSTDAAARLPCITSAQVVRVAVPTTDGQCSLIGPDGARGAVVPCTESRP